MTEVYRKWVASLNEERVKEELLNLQQRYIERGVAMGDTAEQVRSLYVGSEVSKRMLALREKCKELEAEVARLQKEGHDCSLAWNAELTLERQATQILICQRRCTNAWSRTSWIRGMGNEC